MSRFNMLSVVGIVTLVMSLSGPVLAVPPGTEVVPPWMEPIVDLLEPSCPPADDAFTDASGRFVTYPSTDPVEVCDENSGKFWEQDPDSSNRGRMSNAAAQLFCPTLGTGWGLSAIEELRELENFSERQPALTPNVFGGIEQDFYWSATAIPNSDFFWGVNFAFGDITAINPPTTRYVWCVRRTP